MINNKKLDIIFKIMALALLVMPIIFYFTGFDYNLHGDQITIFVIVLLVFVLIISWFITRKDIQKKPTSSNPELNAVLNLPDYYKIKRVGLLLALFIYIIWAILALTSGNMRDFETIFIILYIAYFLYYLKFLRQHKETAQYAEKLAEEGKESLAYTIRYFLIYSLALAIFFAILFITLKIYKIN